MKTEEIKCPITRELIETAKDFPERYKLKLLEYARELILKKEKGE